MAVFGKLYSYPGNARSTAILAVAKANGLEVEVVETEPAKGVSAEYTELNPLAQIPTFVGTDGYVLKESIAIAIYLTSQNEKTTLLGKTKQDYASILQWMSFFNSEFFPTISKWFRPLTGRDPYNKKNVDDAEKATALNINIVEKHLLDKTFLAGERVTLADLFAAGLISRGFQYFFDKNWRSAHPNVTRWYETVYNQPIYSAVVDKLAFIDEPTLKNTPPKKAEQPKKEAAPKAPKAAPKAKEVDEDEDDEPKEAPKPKHPLALLPRATTDLDEWKRQYSNNDTPDALKWFWANYNPEEYSLWTLDYKYNEELTQVFMSSNLIGGFFTRLEASRKFIFGCASVYGEANNSVIKGAFIVRGQDAITAFDVAPDFESYEFTKLDPAKAEDKEFVNEQWTWEKPIVENGKEYKWADGKVFK